MGVYKDIDIDLQELIATVDTVGQAHDIGHPDSEDGLDGRGVLFARLTSLGWLSPTERRVALDHFNRGDGKPLLTLLGGLQVA